MRVSALLLQSKNNHKSSAKQITDILRIIKEVPGCEYAAQLPKTCKMLVNVLSRYSQTPAYRYDLCPNATCTMVYRNQYKSAQRCPKCNTSRHPGKGRGCTMLYHSLVDHGRELFGNEASARCVCHLCNLFVCASMACAALVLQSARVGTRQCNSTLNNTIYYPLEYVQTATNLAGITEYGCTVAPILPACQQVLKMNRLCC